MQLTDFEQKSIEKLCSAVENGMITNNGLVQIIEQCGSFLNLKTISSYAKDNGISYNGAKNFRKKVELLGFKFIIDNE